MANQRSTPSQNGSGPSQHAATAALYFLLAGLSLSLLTPHAIMATCLSVAVYGAWSFVSGAWKWEPRDHPAAAVNIAVVVFAVGSAGICWLKSERAEEMEPYLSLLCAPLLGVGLRQLAPSPARVAGAIALACLLAAVVAGWQISTAVEMQRATTQMGATSFGALGAIYAVLCAGMAGWAAETKAERLLLAIGAVSGIVVSVLSGSRGSWMILAVVLPFAVYEGFAAGNRKLFFAAGTLLVSTFCVASLLPNSPAHDRLIETMRVGDPLRAGFFREGWRAFVSAPLAGMTREDFAEKLDRAWLAVRPYAPHESPPRHAHNELIDAAAVRGVGGLALNTAVLAVPLAVLSRLRRRESRSGPAATGMLFMAAFLLAGTTDLLLQLTARRMVFLFVVLFCVIAATQQDENGQIRETGS